MKKFTLPTKIQQVLLGFTALGIIALAAGFAVDAHRAWAGLLVFTFFLLILSLAGGFFTALQFISGAKWSVVVRRIPETTVMVLPVVGLLLIAVFFGIHHLYEWSHLDVVENDHILKYKSAYLNTPFFIARIVIYFTLWFGLGMALRKVSLAQDESKDPAQRTTLVKLSTAYMLTFAYTFALAAIDLIMSLEPHWFTTMFPVYAFSGLAYSGISAFIILIVTIQKHGGLAEVTEEHMHDLGKFLFVFTTFWAYIAFSQHMLTWYANLPEETYYLEVRLKGDWAIFTAAFWILHFLIPFGILLSRDVKRDGTRLARVAWLTLFMGFVDVVWMVYGGLNIKGFPFGWLELGLFFGAVGVFGYIVLAAYSKNAEVPVGDPMLEESKHFHQPI